MTDWLGITFARPSALWILALVPVVAILGLVMGVRRRGLPRAALPLSVAIASRHPASITTRHETSRAVSHRRPPCCPNISDHRTMNARWRYSCQPDTAAPSVATAARLAHSGAAAELAA